MIMKIKWKAVGNMNREYIYIYCKNREFIFDR